MIRAVIRAILCSGLHAVPIKSGLSALSDSWLARWSCAGVPAARARLRNGLQLDVDLQDYNGRMLFFFGTPDPKVVEVCQGLLRPGDVFLDIGANYGAVGLLCLDIVGPNGEIHFFEPQSTLCEVIRRSVAEAGVTWCRLHEFGLLERGGHLVISAVAGHSGAASLVRPASGAKAAGSVAVRAAAPEIAAAVCDRTFGAKLDVEGGEREVLAAVVTQRRFRFVVFECNRPDERDWAWEFCCQHRLRYFGLRRSMWRVCVEEIKDRKGMDSAHDILAVAASEKLKIRWVGAPRDLAKLLWSK